MYDIVILTDSRYEKPETTDWYINQVILEGHLTFRSTKRKGLYSHKKILGRSRL